MKLRESSDTFLFSSPMEKVEKTDVWWNYFGSCLFYFYNDRKKTKSFIFPAYYDDITSVNKIENLTVTGATQKRRN